MEGLAKSPKFITVVGGVAVMVNAGVWVVLQKVAQSKVSCSSSCWEFFIKFCLLLSRNSLVL